MRHVLLTVCVPPASCRLHGPLVERLGQIRQEVKDLAQAAIADYGNEDPFPGEW